jgi:hypothetical protein
MPLNAMQVRDVVREALDRLGARGRYAALAAPAAVELVCGTFAAESDLRWLRQTPRGPARGLGQMEPASALDLWTNWLRHREREFADGFAAATGMELRFTFEPDGAAALGPGEDAEARRAAQAAAARERLGWLLQGSIALAAVLTRLHYYRFPEALPVTLEEAAAFWKFRYNTVRGAGTPAQFIAAYQRHFGEWPVPGSRTA